MTKHDRLTVLKALERAHAHVSRTVEILIREDGPRDEIDEMHLDLNDIEVAQQIVRKE